MLSILVRLTSIGKHVGVLCSYFCIMLHVSVNSYCICEISFVPCYDIFYSLYLA